MLLDITTSASIVPVSHAAEPVLAHRATTRLPAPPAKPAAAATPPTSPPPSVHPHDEELEAIVARVLAGNDDAARAELLDRVGGLIRVIAVEHAPDDGQVEDIEQECRIHLLKQLKHYDPARPFRPWMMAVVRNCARNCRRSASRWRLQALPEALPLPGPEADGPSQSLDSRELFGRLRESVAALPPIYRAVVERRYFRDDSCESIAAELAIPVGTVKNRLFRARQLLANRLQHLVA